MDLAATAPSRLSACSSAGEGMMFVFVFEIRCFTCLQLNEFVFLMTHSNQHGQLGLGDIYRRGRYSNEMGDNLDSVPQESILLEGFLISDAFCALDVMIMANSDTAMRRKEGIQQVPWEITYPSCHSVRGLRHQQPVMLRM